MQTILLLKSAFLCVFRFFGLSSFDIVTTLILSHLASFLPFFEVIPEIFSNYYIVATKHLKPAGHDIGINLAYRYCPKVYNEKWGGVVGGITWQPRWVPNLRAIVEYTGNEVNVGADCLLWKHLFLQATLQDGKYFSGGVCFCVNLF